MRDSRIARETNTLVDQAKLFAEQVAQVAAHGLREQLTGEIKQLRADLVAVREGREESMKAQVVKLLELRETREEAQLTLERQLLDQARELGEIRDLLRASGIVPPPAVRSLLNGNNDNA